MYKVVKIDEEWRGDEIEERIHVALCNEAHDRGKKGLTERERKRERRRGREREKVDFLINLREKEREKVYSHRYLLASITVNVIGLEVKHRAARVLSRCRPIEMPVLRSYVVTGK